MRYLIAILLLAVGDVAADAAVKAQEGSVDHWIDYYARERAQQAGPSTPQPTNPVKGIKDEKSTVTKGVAAEK